MKLLFKTEVVNPKHTTKHRLGIGEKPAPEIVRLSICEDGGGFFLLHEDDHGSVFDSWHETADEAKHQADAEYEITGWRRVDP